MKTRLLSFLISILSLSSIQNIDAQITTVAKFSFDKTIPTTLITAPDLDLIKIEDLQRDKNGELYRIGVARAANITTTNSGIWKTLSNGSRQWQLHVKSPGAEAISFLFERFIIYGGTTLNIQDLKGKMLHPTMTKNDVASHFMQNAALCFGDEMILTLTEPAYTTPSEIFIDRIMYNYRSTGNPNALKINESDACEINVNCSPVGDNWQNQKRGVARLLVVEGGGSGWCTGSLVNNTALDCKPLFLTALHCGVSATTANMNQWKFYFRYEAPTCTNPSIAGTLDDYFITGCIRLADSNDGGGSTGSDFLLVQMGTAANQAATITTLKSANFNAYWNGWDANNTATTGGAGIHHPAGDIKKISTFNGSTASTTWGGSTPNTHWRITWSANSNGTGVTEGGSSGSPLFNNSSGRIIGTLTGGGSFCTALTQPDSYGKISYHWLSNGAAANQRLKTYLDPGNTGLLVLNGSADPCSANVPTAPIAQFVGAPTTVNTGGTVAFTDQSSGAPTSWAWTISGSGWTYTGGTSATSQNPQVIFNTVGQYTVTLVATNSLGNDSEVKTNYITVVQQTGPCGGSSAVCDEYINTVTLNTINNTSACSVGGYANYSSLSTNLSKGAAYTITVLPGIVGQTAQAYTDDEIAVWIDYNNDMDFSDAGERIAYVMVAAGWSNVFNFTVPTTAVTGSVYMRVRISYSADGAIIPCGQSTFGEVEDYKVNIVASSGLEENLLEQVTLYPNPTQDNITLNFGAASSTIQRMELTSITGQVLKRFEVKNNNSQVIEMSEFAAGVYQVVLYSPSGTITKRIIKN
jgi:PKD repeat protein